MARSLGSDRFSSNINQFSSESPSGTTVCRELGLLGYVTAWSQNKVNFSLLG